MAELLGAQLQTSSFGYQLHTGLTDGGLFSGASLDLNFAANKNLGPLVTFTRASSGTYVGSDGLIKTATTNLLLRSEEFDNASWSKTGLLAFGSGSTVNATVAPNGIATADLLIEDTNTSTHSPSQTITIAAGSTLSASVYVKPAFGTRHIRIQATSDAGANGFRAYFDLSAFSVALQTGGIGTGSAVSNSAQISPVGDGWYRLSCAGTVAAAATSVSLTIFMQSTTTGSASYTGDGTSGIYLWGAQLEQSSAVGEYIPATSTINSAPRFDHNPTTGESLGLLVEEQRTNLFVRSQELDNASWSKVRSTVTGDNTAAPDGTQTAEKVIASTDANTNHFVRQDISVVSGTFYTQTIYAKAAEYNQLYMGFDTDNSAFAGGAVIFTLTGLGSAGATTGTLLSSSIQALSNGWYRCQISATATATATSVFRIQLATGGTNGFTGNGTSGIYLWGAQLEAGAFPTSYIPTTTATVTRSADVASITGANFSSWYRQDEGTVFADAQRSTLIASTQFSNLWSTSDNTANERFIVYNTGLSQTIDAAVTDGGASQASLVALGAITANNSIKTVLAYRANDFALTRNAGIVQSDTIGTLPTVDRIYIGANSTGAGQWTGTIGRLVFWPQRLPNSTLEAVTR